MKEKPKLVGSSECKSHCTENVCCAEQREMSSKGPQSLRRKAAGLWPDFKNHSGRKTIIQTLVNNDVPSTDIMQLPGTQNISSYSTVSQKQQLNMPHTLTGLSSGEIAPQSCSSIPEKRKHEFDERTYPTFRPTFSQQSKQAAKQPLSLFFECCYKRRTY